MEKVKELEQATLDIIKFTNKLRNHSFALEALSTTYQPSSEVCTIIPLCCVQSIFLE